MTSCRRRKPCDSFGGALAKALGPCSSCRFPELFPSHGPASSCRSGSGSLVSGARLRRGQVRAKASHGVRWVRVGPAVPDTSLCVLVAVCVLINSFKYRALFWSFFGESFSVAISSCPLSPRVGEIPKQMETARFYLISGYRNMLRKHRPPTTRSCREVTLWRRPRRSTSSLRAMLCAPVSGRSTRLPS